MAPRGAAADSHAAEGLLCCSCPAQLGDGGHSNTVFLASLARLKSFLAGAKEVVMLDREPIALQCSLLSAQACGLTYVQDYRHHEAPDVIPSKQHQRESSQSNADASDSSQSGSQQHASTSQVCLGWTLNPDVLGCIIL